MNNEQDILEQLKEINILMRVNNILLSRFILQMQTVKKILHLPKLEPFFKFELLDEDYKELIHEFGREDTDKALYWLDRQLVRNKLNCPQNIKKYIRNKLIKKNQRRELKDAEGKETK